MIDAHGRPDKAYLPMFTLKPPHSLGRLALLAVLAPTLSLSAQDDGAAAPAAPAGTAEDATTVTMTPEESAAINDEQAYFAMGYMMGSQMVRLNLGFSDEALGQIIAGLLSAANNEEQPEFFGDALAQAQFLYLGKLREADEQQNAVAQEQAEANRASAQAFLEELDAIEGILKTESGVRYEYAGEVAEGEKPGPNDSVVVNYVGTLLDGTEFDRGTGVEFPLARVVPGFSAGLQQFTPGTSGTLYIPGELGYGMSPPPNSVIQAGSLLVFDVQLLEVKKAPPSPAPTAPQRSRTPPPGGPPDYTPPPPPDYIPPPPPNVTPPPPPPPAPPAP